MAGIARNVARELIRKEWRTLELEEPDHECSPADEPQIDRERIHRILDGLVPRFAEMLNLTGTGADAQTIRTLAKLPALRELDLCECQELDGAALLELSAIKSLRVLRLWDTGPFSLDDFLHLQALPELETLSIIRASGLSREDISKLRQAFSQSHPECRLLY